MSSTTQFHHAHTITTHAETALLRPNPLLSTALATSASASLPPITISPLQGQYLAIQARLLGAKRILEIGALGGYSTIWLASTGAHVTTIEINPLHHQIATENTTGLDVEVILGAALDVLPRLHEQGQKFDMVFVDASWTEQGEYFDWAVRLTRVGGCVYVDNVVRELIELGNEKGVGEGKDLVSLVGRDERVEATLVGCVNSHKVEGESYDGFLLAVVKGHGE